MKIKKLDIARMRQQQAFEFYNKVLACTADIPLEVFTPFYLALEKANKELDEALTLPRKNEMTETITAADERRDRAWRGLNATVQTLLNHFDSKKASRAKDAADIINLYGDPTRLPYTEETGVIKNLVTDFEALPPDYFDEIGLNEWINELDTANSAFSRHLASRDNAAAFKESGRSKAARQAADAAYRTLTEMLYALTFTSEDRDKIIAKIKIINYYIDQENTVMKARRTRSANKREADKNTPGENEPE